MIRIIAVGKIKERQMRELIADYQKRIKRFSKIEIIEVKDIGDKALAQKKEGEQIKSLLSDNFTISLCVEGKSVDSLEFSEIIENACLRSGRNVNFVIGGSYGLSQEIKASSNLCVSLSKLTFTHNFARLLLLEQIYRAFTIINNHSYHK